MSALLVDALRRLQNRRASTLVAMSGLILALTACLLVAMLTVAFSAIDPAIPDPDRVVLLDFKGNPPGRPTPWFTASPVAFGPMLKARDVPLAHISRVAGSGLDVRIEGRLQATYLLLADADIQSLLGLKALHGDLHAALTTHNGIAITSGLAARLWPDTALRDVIGRSLEARGEAGQFRTYTVLAVIPDTDYRSPLCCGSYLVGSAMAMAGFDSQANDMSQEDRDAVFVGNGRVYAKLKKTARVEDVGRWMREAFVASPGYAQLPADWKAGREAAFFRGITLSQLPFEGSMNEARWRLVRSLAAAALLLLLLAALNAMNLQIASLLHRQRETAVRRSLGADDARLVQLWMLEVLVPLLLAVAMALLLAWWMAPVLEPFMQVPFMHFPAPSAARGLISVEVMVGLLLTSVLLFALIVVPSAYIALRRAPLPALQGRTAGEGPWGKWIRQVLFTVQVGGALVLLSLAGVLAAQQYHVLTADRGFDIRNRVLLSIMINPEFVPDLSGFFAALDRHPEIRRWAYSDVSPAFEASEGQIELHVTDSQQRQVLRVTTVSASFFEAHGMRVLAGVPRLGSGEENAVIDAKAASALGFATPAAAVGELLRGGGGYLQEGDKVRRIVAVVNDVKMESARDTAMPQIFLLTDKPLWDVTIHGNDVTRTQEVVRQLWHSHGPPVVYDIKPYEEMRSGRYRQEQLMTSLLAVFALLAVIVAMLGAYALVDDTLRRRRMELVLHRLHGAGHAAIVRQVAREFRVPLGIGIVAAVPLVAWLGTLYLAGFVERVDAGAGLAMPLMVASVCMLLFIALAMLRHVRCALMLHPAESLT